MAKFYGAIGYISNVEKSPGVWVEEITERNYYGDVVRNTRKLQTADKVNDDISISNEFSIVSDPYAMENFLYMKYITFMGVKWKISSVDVQYPRLILSVDGVCNA